MVKSHTGYRKGKKQNNNDLTIIQIKNDIPEKYSHQVEENYNVIF